MPRRSSYRLLLLLSAACVGALPQIGCDNTSGPPPNGQDTTGHEFVWTATLFGEGTASELLDVHILDNGSIAAVGRVFGLDTLGHPDPVAANLLRWDGIAWTRHRVALRDWQQESSTEGLSLTAVTGRGTSLWATGAREVVRDIGATWGEWTFLYRHPLDSVGEIVTMAAVDEQTWWAGGAFGTLVRGVGRTTQRILLPTASTVRALWVGPREGSSEPMVLAGTTMGTGADDRRIFRIAGGVATEALAWPSSRLLTALWFSSASAVYASGSDNGVGELWKHDGTAWANDRSFSDIPFDIGGDAANNIVVVGRGGVLAHYNGSTWRDYPVIVESPPFLRAVSVRGRIVCAVGTLGNRAVIVRGQRQN